MTAATLAFHDTPSLFEIQPQSAPTATWTEDAFPVDLLERETETSHQESSLFGCPWCSGHDLHELSGMLWCKCCEEPAWYDQGNGLVRADQMDMVTSAGSVSEDTTSPCLVDLWEAAV